jgi:hypothetical protein
MKKGSGGFWLYARIAAINIAVVVDVLLRLAKTPPSPTLFRPFVLAQQTKPNKIRYPQTELLSVVWGWIWLSVRVRMIQIPPVGRLMIRKLTLLTYRYRSNDRSGTTLIYGHNQGPVFGALHTIIPGSEAVVYADSGWHFRYIYQSMRQVLPSDTSVFQDNGKPTLSSFNLFRRLGYISIALYFST